jgi:hypothetical protein
MPYERWLDHSDHAETGSGTLIKAYPRCGDRQMLKGNESLRIVHPAQ